MIMNVDTVRGTIMETKNLNSNTTESVNNFFDEVLDVTYGARYRLKITVSNNVRGLSVFYTNWVYFDIDYKVLKELKNKIEDIDGIYPTLQMQRVKRSEVVEVLEEVESLDEEQ